MHGPVAVQDFLRPRFARSDDARTGASRIIAMRDD